MSSAVYTDTAAGIASLLSSIREAYTVTDAVSTTALVFCVSAAYDSHRVLASAATVSSFFIHLFPPHARVLD